MATPEQCPFYKKCGYIAWRQNRPAENMLPLPENGDCGKEVKKCPRYKFISTRDENIRKKINSIFRVENVYTHKLPISNDEMEIVYPLLPEGTGHHKKKRMIGGGHQ